MRIQVKKQQQHRIQCWLFHNETAKSNYFDFGRFGFLLVFAHSIETKTYNSENEMDLSEIRVVANVTIIAIASFVNLLNCLSYAYTHSCTYIVNTYAQRSKLSLYA